MKKPSLLGILGGLGPMSGAYLYEYIIAHTRARCDQEHIDVILSGRSSTPDRTAFITGESSESPLPVMIGEARRLEMYGCDAIVIACNTAHYFIDEVRASVNVPVPSIITETAELARATGKRRVGIMATRGTLGAMSYQNELERLGLEWCVPDEENQALLGSLIYDSVKAGGKIDTDKFYTVAKSLERQGADGMILGCTELSVINRSLPHDPKFIDSTEALAYYSICMFGKEPTDFPEEFSMWSPNFGLQLIK